jgi:Ger(x)C family germination protein
MDSKKILRILFVCFLLSGCHNGFEDPEYRQIVTALGIDTAAKNQIQLTMRAPILFPVAQGRSESGDSGANRGVITHSSFASGISKALENIELEDERSLFINQCKTIILGEAISQKGLQDILGNLERLSSLPPLVYIAVAKGSPNDILGMQFETVAPADLQIVSFLNKQNYPFRSTMLWEIYQKVLDPLKDPIIPLIEATADQKSLRFLGLALFKDDRMVGALGMDQSILLAVAGNFLKTGTISLFPEKTGMITIKIADSHTAIKTDYRNEHLLFKFKIKIDAVILEQTIDKSPLNIKKVDQLTRKMERILKQSYFPLLYQLQQFQSDPLQLGDLFRIQSPKRFQMSRWPEEYRKAKFQVDMHLNIIKTGTLK